MKDVEALVADAEQRWSSLTNEQREDLVKKLRSAEAEIDDDALLRTRLAGLIHQIQAAERHHGTEYVVPPLSQGSGFGYGATLPSKLDLSD
jgi:hypothetical protein